MRTQAAALLLTLTPAAAFAQAAVPQPATQQPTTLDIVATGHASRTPDIATITAGVVTQASRAGDAMAANAKAMTAAIAALKRAGVAERDIATSSLNLQPQYRYADNQPPVLTGYQSTNQLSVKFRVLKQAGAILDALVAQGINQINGPNLSIDNPDAALDEARVQAIAIARARADLYAKAAGMRVARVTAIREPGASGPTPPPPMPMMMMRAKADAASTPLEAGSQELDVTVNVTFELQ